MIWTYEMIQKYRPDIDQVIPERIRTLVEVKLGACPKNLTYYDLLRVLALHYDAKLKIGSAPGIRSIMHIWLECPSSSIHVGVDCALYQGYDEQLPNAIRSILFQLPTDII